MAEPVRNQPLRNLVVIVVLLVAVETKITTIRFRQIGMGETVEGSTLLTSTNLGRARCAALCSVEQDCTHYQTGLVCTLIRAGSQTFQSTTSSKIYKKQSTVLETSVNLPPDVYYHDFEDTSGLTLTGAQQVAGYAGGFAVRTIKTNSEWITFGTSASAACILRPETCLSGATVSAWFRIWDCSNPNGFLTSVDGGYTGVQIYCDGVTKLSSRLIFPDGDYYLPSTVPTGWFHMVVTFTPAPHTLVAYYDSVYIGSASTKRLFPNNPGQGELVLGRFYVSGDQFYGNVEVDELMFWNQDLQQQQVVDLFNSYN